MDLQTLQTLLGSPRLTLTQEGTSYRAPDDANLTIFVSQGSDLVRLPKVTALEIGAGTDNQGLLGLEREDAYAIIALSSVAGIEQTSPEEKRSSKRTGFI